MTALHAKATSHIDPVRAHCEMLHGLADGIDGVFVVSAYFAAGGNGTVTRHNVGDVDGMVEAITAHSDTSGANVYTGLHLMKRSLARGKRGTKADIVAVLGLVADQDADTGNTGGLPCEPNYIIETSPGNQQPAWLFDRPLPVDEATPLAAALKRATGSDHGTADVDHVWRIPGTKNWPNAAKLKRGRSPEPVPVRYLQEWQGEFTEVDAFRAALAPWESAPASEAKPVQLGELPDVGDINASADAAAMLAANDVGDRSKHASKVVEKLAFDGHGAEAAAALFLAATGDWLARYSTEERARADFARLWAKYGSARAERRDAGAAIAASLTAKVPGKAANDNVPATTKPDRYPGMVSSGEFVRGFKPPDYHVDGISQKGYLYSTTAMTGTGKTAVLLLIAALTMLGKPLGDREVEKGRVVYFAGENPDDVRMRWIAMAHHLDFDPDVVDVHFIAGTFGVAEMFERIKRDVEKIGGVDMIVVDTSAAYFHGDDENSNTQLGTHARNLRALTTLPGKPVVYAACHPIKNADPSNLLPRGGGAFIAEVDGNLTLNKGETVKLHHQGKHRGPDFEPIHFELKTVTAPALVDSKGRPVPTVMAEALTKGESVKRADKARNDDDEVLLAIERGKGASLTEIAETLCWFTSGGAPHKDRVRHAKDRLYKRKLVDVARKGWKLTPKGREAAVEARADKHSTESAAKLSAGLVRNRDS
jgi:AAA domain/RepB DNA-primase from phage plasmid